ncbi:MAG: precorrin-2 C(20)-methyltransferase [Coriobacteriia bacterium]|nr:precorrin-2 C(20)-methyltransferase [Coriobacteriia bacterium]
MRAVLYGIGAGPGDPDLITLRGYQILQDADLILLADSGSKSVLDPFIAQFDLDDKVLRVDVPMTQDQDILDEAHEEMFETIKTYLDNDQIVAHLVLGDPSLYSSFSYIQKRALEAEYEVRVIPGIVAPSAGAALAQLSLAQSEEELHFVPALDQGQIAKALERKANIVFFKAKKHFNIIVEELKKRDLLKQSYLVEKVGMPGERLSKDLLNTEAPSSYFTTIFVRNSTQN